MGNIWETTRRQLRDQAIWRDNWETSGRHLGDISETSGRHLGRLGASGRSTKCHPWGVLKDIPLFSWLQAVPRGNNPRQGAGSAILSHEFTKVMFSLDVFPTFLRTSLTECYVLKVQLPTSRFPTPGHSMVSSRRERHFFKN